MASTISVLAAGVMSPRRLEVGQIRHPAGSRVFTDSFTDIISGAPAPLPITASYNIEIAELDTTTSTRNNSWKIFRLRAQAELYLTGFFKLKEAWDVEPSLLIISVVWVESNPPNRNTLSPTSQQICHLLFWSNVTEALLKLSPSILVQ